jgi:hypothetical protein
MLCESGNVRRQEIRGEAGVLYVDGAVQYFCELAVAVESDCGSSHGNNTCEDCELDSHH